MPFQSQSQRAFMYIHHPDIAKRWEKITPSGKLPKHVNKHKMKALREHYMLATGRLKVPEINNIHKKHKMTRIMTHSIHKHTSAHDKMSVGEMHKHHMAKMHPAHPAHPMHKHYKAGTTNVRRADGTHGTMKTASDHGA